LIGIPDPVLILMSVVYFFLFIGVVNEGNVLGFQFA